MINLRDSLSNVLGSLPTPSSILAIGRSRPDSELTAEMAASNAQAIPSALITEEWQLVLGQNATLDELENAITKTKELVIVTDECSDERKWLVRHLVELRFRLNELRDMASDDGPTELSKVIIGHHFVITAAAYSGSGTLRCDNCAGIIWSVVQASYTCQDCQFRVHYKCLRKVHRICAHVVATEQTMQHLEISPEIGLAAQNYKCAECDIPLVSNNIWMDARQCDYTGLYYCTSCHWNDKVPTPARVIHNWDLQPRKVCRASLQLLRLTHQRADINVAANNAKLFVYVHTLSVVQKLRDNVVQMRRYLDECRLATSERLVERHIDGRRHLIECSRIDQQMYSMADLLGVENGTLVEHMQRLFDAFDRHIRTCAICAGKGYLCEICGNNEVLFPHDDGAVRCTKSSTEIDDDDVDGSSGRRRRRCGQLYHRACWMRKGMQCPKCKRLAERSSVDDQICEPNFS